MQLRIEAHGEAARYFEPNALALGLDDPDDLVGPDPVLLWLRGVEAGFADSGTGELPQVELKAAEFDAQRHQQRWRIEATDLDRGQLLIVRNLIAACGVEVLMFDDAGHERLPLETLAYPATQPAAGVEWDWVAPDEQDMVRHRELRIEFSQALFEQAGSELVIQLREQLDVWAEVVGRSGWCPADEDPANSGAMPAFSYALDSHTLALEFDGFFRADEACFDAIASWTHRLQAQGIAVSKVSVR